jgi:Na+/H+ antiporter NhaC
MEWLKVVPPLVAVIIVIWKKEVILALLLAIFVSEWLLVGDSGLLAPATGGLATLDRISGVFADPGNTRILVFSVLVGALLAYMRKSGGVTGLVKLLISKGLAKSPRQVSLMASITGVVVFIESNLSVLTAGILSRGLFDKFGLSRAKLAYIIDSTSAPICILILLNAWGAYILALLGNYQLESSSAEILWGSVPFNFYAIITLLIVFYSAFTGNYYGPLARSKAGESNISNAANPSETIEPEAHPAFMVVPILVMVVGMVGFMLWTGNGVLAEGSGSKSVFYATSLACLVAYMMMLASRRFKHQQLVKIGFNGMAELLPLVTIVLLSLALGASLKQLGTGLYISQIVGDFLPVYLVAPIIFIVGGIMSFSTGTSWGTFAILIPIGVPIIQVMGLPPELIIGAILGGGIFGDHCSPISDTTAVSSIASGCDLLEHVKTQLPYALVAGGASIILYLIVGLVVL